MKVFAAGITLAAVVLSVGGAVAAADETPGVTASEIRIGQTMAYSGPASAYGIIGHVEAAYFKMVNEKGGIKGRMINFITVDDGYSPPKTVEQTRRLVEQEQVAVILNPLGTPTGLVVRKYLNEKKVPQLFVGAGATMWADYEHYPWSIGFQPNYHIEGGIYAKHTLQTKPEAKVAIFYQNDDAGRDYANGFKAGLGPEGVKKNVIFETTYETTDPTIDSQMLALQQSGADTLFMHAIPKQAAQAIRKAAQLNWKPVFYLASVSASVGSVLKPAGLENSIGLITAAWLKDPNDPQWAKDAGYLDWAAFMKKYDADADLVDVLNVYCYTVAQTMTRVLEQCGDDFSRENIMKQVTSLDFNAEMLLPGISIKTSPTNYYPLTRMQLQRFDGKVWVNFGEVIGD